MGALDLIQLQRPSERLQDLVGDPAGVAALKARVVLDRDAGQQGYFLPAQPGHPPVPAVGRKAGLGGVSLARRVVRNWRISARTSLRLATLPSLPGAGGGKGVPASTPIGRVSPVPVIKGSMGVSPR